jgi:hypothetical protein
MKQMFLSLFIMALLHVPSRDSIQSCAAVQRQERFQRLPFSPPKLHLIHPKSFSVNQIFSIAARKTVSPVRTDLHSTRTPSSQAGAGTACRVRPRKKIPSPQNRKFKTGQDLAHPTDQNHSKPGPPAGNLKVI